MFGVFGLTALGAHGATFIVWKTAGELNGRSRAIARRLWQATLVLVVLATVLTSSVAPEFFATLRHRPLLWSLPLVAFGSGVLALRWVSSGHERRAFVASSGFIGVFLLATAGALYPVLLRSTVDPAFTLDAYNAASARSGLSLGLFLWIPAIVLSLGYLVYLLRTFRGKAGTGHY